MINKYMPVQAHFMIKKYWMRVSGVAQGSEHCPTHTEAYQKIFLSFFAPTHMWFTLFVFNQRKNSFRGSIHLCSTVWDFYMTSACINLLLKLVHKLQSENIKWCVLFTHRNKNREDLLETKINAREVSLSLQSNRIPRAAHTPWVRKGIISYHSHLPDLCKALQNDWELTIQVQKQEERFMPLHYKSLHITFLIHFHPPTKHQRGKNSATSPSQPLLPPPLCQHDSPVVPPCPPVEHSSLLPSPLVPRSSSRCAATHSWGQC